VVQRVAHIEWVAVMKTSEFREQANKCRRHAAATYSSNLRTELLTTAELFDELADARERQGERTKRRRKLTGAQTPNRTRILSAVSESESAKHHRQ
jgi:hypothetical protein